MRIGERLLELARDGGRRSLFVVGTGKNVGKTVAMRSVASSAAAQGLRVGITSTGRDGEAVDASDSLAKPRLLLAAGTVVATARNLLPPHPASEILDVTGWNTAAGSVVLVRVRQAAYYEIAGPATAAGVRDCVERFAQIGCDQVVVDGALDRVAAVAGGNDAVVVATGASAASTMQEAVDDACALVRRLSLPAFDPRQPFVRIDGALTPALASGFLASKESRQIVVRDPTQVAIPGKALLGITDRLTLRCERPIAVVAATVASIGRDRYFEPRAFLEAVARSTGLPTFDVYAGATARAA